MKKHLLTIATLLQAVVAAAQSGNHVSSGTESNNFSVVDLQTSASWVTDRGALPGYFSAQPGAVYINASNTSNIDGYVKEYSNPSFSFPVGNGTALRTLMISGAPATNTIATAWISGDPTGTPDPTDPAASQLHSVHALSGTILSVSDKGQWDWLDFDGNSAGTIVTVSFPDLSMLNPAPALSDLRLVGWNGSSWIDLSTVQGSGAATGTLANGMLSGTMQAGITAVGIGSTNSLLPVTIMSLAGKANGSAALLNWATASEANSRGFNVQRSTGGINYYNIGYVGSLAVNGNSTSKLSYGFMDNSPATGTNYYRLQQMDLDGHSDLTYAVKVEFRQAMSVNIWPNPATNYIQVAGAAAGSKLLVLNMQGQIVLPYTTNKTIDVQRFSKGNYVLQVIAQNGQTQSFKFIKQ